MATYKGFQYNSAGAPRPWGATENQLDKDIIDNILGDACQSVSDTGGHKHNKVYDEYGSEKVVEATGGNVFIGTDSTHQTLGIMLTPTAYGAGYGATLISQGDSSVRQWYVGGVGNVIADRDSGAGKEVSIVNNGYVDSSGDWVYIDADYATRMLEKNGNISLQHAPEGIAGGAITWDTVVEIGYLATEGSAGLGLKGNQLFLDSAGRQYINQSSSDMVINNTDTGKLLISAIGNAEIASAADVELVCGSTGNILLGEHDAEAVVLDYTNRTGYLKDFSGSNPMVMWDDNGVELGGGAFKVSNLQSTGYLSEFSDTGSVLSWGDSGITLGTSKVADLRSGVFKLSRTYQATPITPASGELAVWTDSSTSKTYLCYNDPTIGQRRVELNIS